jgi:hypothetical protein
LELVRVLGYKNREIIDRGWSEAYYDLHDGLFSVRQNGLVVVHADNVWLTDCKFAVQPAGNAKVRSTGVKNVHAYVRGHYIGHDLDFPTDYEEYLYSIGYNRGHYSPKQVTSFIDYFTREPIYEAAAVVLIDKKIFYR